MNKKLIYNPVNNVAMGNAQFTKRRFLKTASMLGLAPVVFALPEPLYGAVLPPWIIPAGAELLQNPQALKEYAVTFVNFAVDVPFYTMWGIRSAIRRATYVKPEPKAGKEATPNKDSADTFHDQFSPVARPNGPVTKALPTHDPKLKAQVAENNHLAPNSELLFTDLNPREIMSLAALWSGKLLKGFQKAFFKNARERITSEAQEKFAQFLKHVCPDEGKRAAFEKKVELEYTRKVENTPASAYGLKNKEIDENYMFVVGVGSPKYELGTTAKIALQEFARLQIDSILAA